MKIVLLLLKVLACCFFVGCAQKLGYNPSYLNYGYNGRTLKGQAQIVMSEAHESFNFVGNPSSLTGSALTFTIPVGFIMREAALQIFEGAFSEGASFSNEADYSGKYRVIVQPEFKYLDFKFNQLKNAGFAITPEAEVRLQIVVLDDKEKVVLDKVYSNGLVSGDAYVASLNPKEKINLLIHQQIQLLLRKATEELALILE